MPETSQNTTFRSAAITHYGEPYDGLPDKLQYIAFAREICPSTQRVHYQSWAYAKKPMRLTQWKKILPGDHIEQMRGTFAQNDAYCSKEGQLTEFGEKPMGNGQKRTLENLSHTIVEAAEQGIPICDVVTQEENRSTFVQYNNGLTKLYQHAVTAKLRKVDKNFAPEVIYVHGPPRLGKSRYVHDMEPDIYKVPISDKYKWKDGYCGQDAVLYDNISPENVSVTELLIEIDRYYSPVPTKGGFVGWRPRRIYLTSIFGLDDFAKRARFSDPVEFTGRITKVVNIADWLAERALIASRLEELDSEVAAWGGPEGAT